MENKPMTVGDGMSEEKAINPLHKLDNQLDEVSQLLNKIIEPIKNEEFRKAIDHIAFEVLVVQARLRKSYGWDKNE